MKKSIIASIFLLVCVIAYFYFKKSPQEQYQDIVINNVIVSKGTRECASRYKAIKKYVLSRYKRPFTVLDIGASQGYFSFRIASDFDAVCTMIEGGHNDTWKTADQLLQLCHLNNSLNNIILLKRRISTDELKVLASCEHFDVVLAFNVIHHFGSQWKEAADAILDLGDNIIIETPTAQDAIAQKNKSVAPLEKYLLEKNGRLILKTSRHTNPKTKRKTLWFSRNKERFSRKYWLWLEKWKKGPYIKDIKIKSDFSKKILTKEHNNLTRPWHSGINLLTFKMLNGVYPSMEKVMKQVMKFKDYKHNDLTVWNMIIQGENIIMIDQDDERWKLDSSKAFSFAVKLLKQANPEQTRKFFENDFELFAKNALIKDS